MLRGITYLSDDLRRLCVVDSLQILLHGCIVISFLIQEVTIFAVDDVLLGVVDAELLRKVYGKNVEMALIQYLKFLLDCLFMISEDLSWSAMN